MDIEESVKALGEDILRELGAVTQHIDPDRYANTSLEQVRSGSPSQFEKRSDLATDEERKEWDLARKRERSRKRSERQARKRQIDQALDETGDSWDTIPYWLKPMVPRAMEAIGPIIPRIHEIAETRAARMARIVGQADDVGGIAIEITSLIFAKHHIEHISALMHGGQPPKNRYHIDTIKRACEKLSTYDNDFDLDPDERKAPKWVMQVVNMASRKAMDKWMSEHPTFDTLELGATASESMNDPMIADFVIQGAHVSHIKPVALSRLPGPGELDYTLVNHHIGEVVEALGLSDSEATMWDEGNVHSDGSYRWSDRHAEARAALGIDEDVFEGVPENVTVAETRRLVRERWEWLPGEIAHVLTKAGLLGVPTQATTGRYGTVLHVPEGEVGEVLRAIIDTLAEDLLA